jgi:RHS repeat-associated protein
MFGEDLDEDYELDDINNINAGLDGFAAYGRQNLNQYWRDLLNQEVGTGRNIVSSTFEVQNNDREVYLSRAFLHFNTSSLPDDAYVYDASLNFDVEYENGWGIYLVESLAATSTSLSAEDFSRVGEVVGSFVNVEDTGYYSMPFNEEALSWISTIGWTKLALRGGHDLFEWDFNPPGQSKLVGIYASETAGTEHDPYLMIEYTLDQPPVAEDLQVNGQTNPDDLDNEDLIFSAVYNNDDENEQAISYKVQLIAANGDFDNPLWDSGIQDLATAIDPGERSEDIAYTGDDLDLDGWQYFWRIKFWNDGDEITQEGLWSTELAYFYMDGSLAPGQPTGLLTENRVESINVIDQTPSFSAIYHDPNPIDLAKWYRIQVDNNADFSSPAWDSQKTLLNNLINNGAWSEQIQYAGDALPYDGITYYWRVKFWDDEGESGTEGEWSEAGTFSMFDLDDLLTDVRIKGAKYHYDFESGNLLREENFGEVNAANNGIYLDEEGDEKNTDYDYATPTNPSSHIIAAPKEKILTSPNNFEEAEVRMYYDDLAFGQVASANVTKEDLVVEAVEYEKDFNAYGLVVETTDPLDHSTTIDYDDDYYYPAETTNHLNQTTLTEYDLKTGQLTRSEDPNGLIEERDYDAFGRLIEVRKTDPANVQNLITLQIYQYNDAASPSWAKQSVKVDSQNWLDSYTYFDGLGRTIQTREESDNGNYLVVSYKYDSRGNLERQSIPYVQNGSAYTAPTWNLSTQPYTSYEYDGQNRVTSEIFQSSTQSWTTAYDYDGWNVIITDALGNQKKLYKDAYGQLVRVDEYLDQQVYSTEYEYNLLGKLTKITDSQDNERNFTYDSLGRLTSQEEMHTPQAQDFGVWFYEYDDASNLIRKTDPKNQTVEYDYDNLNRLMAEDFLGRPGTEVVYNYDEGPYAIGRLNKVSFGLIDDDIKNFGYDVWGRVISEDGIINDHDYEMAFSYTLTSQPDAISYVEPEEYNVSYGYDALGRGVSLTVDEPNEDPVDLIDNVAYSPLKQIAGISYTNGIETTNTFDPLQAYRLTNKLTVDDQDNVLQDLDYTYDDVGNITGLLDDSETILAKTTGYTYDDLYRLTSATVTNSANNADYARTYAYDPIGNITFKSDLGPYQYQNDNPYQANLILGFPYTYDDNGNLSEDQNQIYNYVYNDRLKSVTNRTLPINSLFDYDHTGQRVYKRVDDGSQMPPRVTETVYPNKYLEFDYLNGDYQMAVNITKHLYFGNQRVGQVKKFPQPGQPFNVINLVFTDHLGSSSLVTNEDGEITAVYDYYPYGESRIADEILGETNRLFTGQERDQETALDYFGQRYYVASLGRFNRQDPWGGDPSNPQTLNKYSYSLNNPLTYFDPTGEKVEIIARGLNDFPWGLGVHTFLRVTPDNPEDFDQEDGYSFILGGYWNTENNKLEKRRDDEGDKNLSEDKTKEVREIDRPEDMTDTDFIKQIEEIFESYDDSEDYNALSLGDGYNCNNFSTTLIVGAGGKLPDDYNPKGFNHGLGEVIPSIINNKNQLKVEPNYQTDYNINVTSPQIQNNDFSNRVTDINVYY